MTLHPGLAENLRMEKRLARQAASQGAQIILLPELFENWYFCQEKSYENYHLATTLEENPAVREIESHRAGFSRGPAGQLL